MVICFLLYKKKTRELHHLILLEVYIYIHTHINHLIKCNKFIPKLPNNDT